MYGVAIANNEMSPNLNPLSPAWKLSALLTCPCGALGGDLLAGETTARAG